MSFRKVADPEVRVLGAIPSIGAFGPDTVVAFSQELVGKDADIQQLLRTINESAKDTDELNELTFKKHLSGIGRGHALDGLPVVAFAIKGSKMLDSALTGAVYSRALASSSRRKQSTIEDLYIPATFWNHPEIEKQYKEVNERIFAAQSEFAALGKPALATFNKLRAYNDTCEMLYVVPLSTLVNLTVNVNPWYTPLEVQLFVKSLPDLLRPYGLEQMYKLRCAVPRETYQHYTVFTDPADANWLSQQKEAEAEMGNKIRFPQVMFDTSSYLTLHAKALAERMSNRLHNAAEEFAGESLEAQGGAFYEAVSQNAHDLSKLTRRFNEALFVRTRSAISWRVWSEQKRHGTLKQQVISVYEAAHAASIGVGSLLAGLSESDEPRQYTEEERALFMDFFVIDPVLKQDSHSALCDLYIDLTLRQMAVYRMIEQGCAGAVYGAVQAYDLLYCVPRNLILDTLETYDVMNLFSLELPLRLCSTCEVEREATSEAKASSIRAALPDAYGRLLQPKCNLGYCPEAKCCGKVKEFNPYYTNELHAAIAKHIENLGRN